MKRRNFVINSSLASTGLILTAGKTFGIGQTGINNAVKRVHVIFKTHLDIGFTDLARNVINTYLTEFIPTALTLSEQLRAKGETDRYIWTTGSWLIYEFLERAEPEQKRRMEKAIESGDIVWHGLPFSTHTELIDVCLYKAGLQLSSILDKRFYKKTNSAKMTDVPGHTLGIVPLLQNAGIKLLHIGVNPASTPPDVPALFNWQSPDGSEIIIAYQKDYGETMIIPNSEIAVSINFTGDNHGPHRPDQISKIYEDLRKQFPGAKVFGSDLNAVTDEVYTLRKSLPIITRELGDSWIHGSGSDPKKVTQLRELSRLRNQWIDKKQLIPESSTDLKFSIPLLMMAEHTWGLDVKTYLKDWDIYSQEAFNSARTKPNFRKMEQSWKEKREYAANATESLPVQLASEATEMLSLLEPEMPDKTKYEKVQELQFETKHFVVSVANTGALDKLKNNTTGKDWSAGGAIGLFAYQTFSANDYDRFLGQYLTQRPEWALNDFGKTGLEIANPKSETFTAVLNGLFKKTDHTGEKILLELSVSDSNEKTPVGCPATINIEYCFLYDNPEIEVTLTWFNKAATRLPEAVWFSFMPKTETGTWTIEKMGQAINTWDVVRNGNRKMHVMSNGFWLEERKQKFRIESPDAYLVAVGERNLLNFDNKLPEAADGMHFCLCNNVWGTNFVEWFDDNMKFRFRLM
jgi:hypothetical protein